MSRQVKAIESIPSDQEKKKYRKLGVHSFKWKKRRQSAAVERRIQNTEVGVEDVGRQEHRLRKCPSNLVIPGGKGLHQFCPSCLEREQLVVGSGSSDFTEATSKSPRRRSLCEFIRNARVADCSDASVAPWRFGSGSVAHVLHACRNLKQICATAGRRSLNS